MQATDNFTLRMYPDAKKMLRVIASCERRSKANVIDVLIRERFEALKGQKIEDPKPAQEQPAAASL